LRIVDPDEKEHNMRAAIFEGPATITVRDVPDPVIHWPDEAVVRVTHA
jgi:hypothetical protein